MTEPPLPEESIFAQALEITSAAERAAFLDRSCGNNRALRTEIEALLRAQERSGDLLDLPENESFTTELPASEGRGTVIGPYKLLEAIGEGGMGTVWMAEQTDPIKRRVAIKVVKDGMDSRHVLARFDAERQALALMEHPNIAKVLDAGKSPSGRPYFVMELVKGMPITKYCDEKRLGVRERLALFGDVCRAIQHAHQKGIIHRDLKPSNVLIAPYDGKPVVKVIDFGVAKATGQRLTEKTLFTSFGALVGTPEYMSPEQAELNNQDIDTRSDIYSLGVLLYELLTGSTPLTRKRLREVAILEVLRVIREEDPPRPSTRLSESNDSLPSISVQRQTEPAKLTRLVRGELDWIVMRALEKDRNRRYETANGFALDVERYLADEPVLACPPSTWYRLRKLARRNRGRFVVAGVLVVALMVAGGAIGWTALDRAARQTKAANELQVALGRAEVFQGRGKRAEALAALERADSLAGQSRIDSALGQRLATVKDRLAAEGRDEEFIGRFDDIRLRVESQVKADVNDFSPELALPEIRDALIHCYGIEIGTGSPARASAIVQGRPETVRASLVAALDRCLRWTPDENAQSREWLLATLAAADSDSWRARVRKAMLDGDIKALEALARAVDVPSQPPSFLLLLVKGLTREGLLPYKTRHLSKDELVDRIPWEFIRRIQRAYPTDLWANHELGLMLASNGRPAEAVRYYTAAIALRPDNAGIYYNRGKAFRDAGELNEAVADYYQAVALAPAYPHAYNDLGTTLHVQGKADEAIACYQKAISIDPKHALAYNNLGAVLFEKGKVDEAIACYQKAIALNPNSTCARHNLGDALKSKGRLDEAIAWCQKAIAIDPRHAHGHCSLGLALVEKGKLDSAIASYQEAIAIDPRYAQAHMSLGVALVLTGRVDDAVACYRKAIALDPKYSYAHYNLGEALLGQGQVDEAIACFRQSIGLNPTFYLSHYDLALALTRLGKVDEVIAEYRQAIKFKADYAPAHCNLGLSLMRTGQFREALETLRRGHEIGSRNSRWANPSAQWVRQCERLIELEEKLPAILEGKSTPPTAEERIELASLCSIKHLYHAAVRFSEKAFAAKPALAKLGTYYRYNAACAAALAGCGQGNDADKLNDIERARVRRQALDWLRADLDDWKRLAHEKPEKIRPVLVERMRHWRDDDDLAGVRRPEALAKLPEPERETWQKLWDDVAHTLASATPEQKSAAK